MSKITNLQQDLVASANMQAAVVALQEVSVMRMQRVRSAVLKTRDYQFGLLSVFGDLKQANLAELNQLLKPQSWWNHRSIQVRTRQNNGRKVMILAAPDQRFAGSIAAEVFAKFVADLAQTSVETECVVIGQVGRDLFVNHFGPTKKFAFYDYQEAKLETTPLTELTTHLLQYQDVNIYHGQFKSFASQVPLQLSLTATESLLSDDPRKKSTAAQTKVTFLFEPDLQKLVSFFETEVFTLLLKLALHESRLANLGSRITALESSHQAMVETRRHLHRTYQLAKKQSSERKQRQRIAGRVLWSAV